MVAITRADAAPFDGRPCNLVTVSDAGTGQRITQAFECAHPHAPGTLRYLDPETGTWIAGSLNALIVATLNGTMWSARS